MYSIIQCVQYIAFRCTVAVTGSKLQLKYDLRIYSNILLVYFMKLFVICVGDVAIYLGLPNVDISKILY